MIGIDIVKVDRIKRLIDRFGEKALEKFLTKEEISLIKKVESVAGFFAAKEAVAKALGTGIGKECSFFDIKIHKDENGAPFFTLSREIVEKYAIFETALSITHEKDYAIAVAVISSKLKFSHKLFH